MTRLRIPLVLAFALTAGMLSAGSSSARPHRHPHGRAGLAAARPVLVELFTAQGCEGCPQADLMLGELAKKKGVVALSFSVDVWDYTGWKDTLAQPEFTDRQKAYVRRFRQRELSTPEVVVDGDKPSDGLDKDKIAELIDAAAGKAAAVRRPPPQVKVSRHDDWVEVASAKAPPAALDVWMVRYDPKPREVKVKLGDNKGKTVVVSNAVRELMRLGAWRGRMRRFDLPESQSEGLRTVVVVQGEHGGPVVAIGRGPAGG